MSAPPPVKTIRQILHELNGPPLGIGPWIVADGYFALTAVNVTRVNLEFNSNFGIVAKVFFNQRTGEIRTYAAKYLDIPSEDRETLWTR